MGGTKKKSISQAEKSQAMAAKKQERKPRDMKTIQQSKSQFALQRLDDGQVLKSLAPLKAITVYSAAKSLNVKASIAAALLKSFEARATLKKVGGYSGHYVYAISSR